MTADLASLYLEPNVIDDVLKRNDMQIDLSHTPFFIQGRDEGLREGRDEGQREMIRRVLTSRFDDPAITARATTIPDTQLLDAIDRATTADASEFTAWLDQLQS